MLHLDELINSNSTTLHFEKSTIAELAKLTNDPLLNISAAAIPIGLPFAINLISASDPHSPKAEVEKFTK